MADKKRSEKIPEYVAKRAELLAELALARISGLKAYRLTDQHPFDKLAITERGFCFFVTARGFSSSGDDDVDARDELTFPADHALLGRARVNESPVLLFYFNADTDHGRYLRLDTLADVEIEELRLPIENTITKASVQKLIREIQAAPKTSQAS